TAERPYRFDELSETVIHTQVLSICHSSQDETKRFYMMGQGFQQLGQGTVQEDNWVVLWFLWHSFRYRDNRESGASNGAYQGYGGE
ncbi:hypothetical protein K491DRAFT_604424, partial [Lophiostoma macrostomum CBS 122681]